MPQLSLEDNCKK